MTVAQLTNYWGKCPAKPSFCFEGDGAFARVANVSLEKAKRGLPDEVILSTDAEE